MTENIFRKMIKYFKDISVLVFHSVLVIRWSSLNAWTFHSLFAQILDISLLIVIILIQQIIIMTA